MVCIGATIGKVGFATREISCNQQINTLTPLGKYEAKIFYYILSTKSFFNKIIKGSSRATLPIINKGKWENLLITFPKSLSEQKSIVKKLGALSAETKKLEAIYSKKLANLEELKKSVLKSAFTPNSGFGETKQAFSGELRVTLDQVLQTQTPIPSAYKRNQVHAAIVEQVLRDGGWTTEVSVAKYDHLLQEVCGVPLGYQFQEHQFGPFDAQIKRLVSSGLGRNKWFSKNGIMITLGTNIGALLSKQSNLYRAAQSAMRNLAKLGVTKFDAGRIELLSTVCHSIKETKSTTINTVRNFMSQWPTDGNRTKADKFSLERTQKCLDFVIYNDLHVRLLR